jgi:hypothetical protein
MARPKAEDQGNIQETATETQPQQAQSQTADRKVRPMEVMRFNGEEFSRMAWVCTAFEHTNPEDLLQPEYWAHVATKLTPRSRIEAWADDGSWMAEYVVLEAGRNWARLHLLTVHHFTSADIAQTLADRMSPYEITHRGPHAKWSVIRKSDRQVLSEGYETARGAAEYMDERLKADRR